MENKELKIDQYLLDQLSVKEKLEIEQLIKTNSTFAKQVEDRKEIVLMAKLIGQRKRIAKLKDLANQSSQSYVEKVDSNSKSKELVPAKSSRFKFVAMAAAFGLLLIGLGYLFYPLNSSSLDPIVEQHYQVYPIPKVRAIDVENKTMQEQAAEFYKQGNYSKTIETFKSVDDLNFENHLILGISYFELSNYELALQQFNTITSKTARENLFVNKGKWYQSLTLLQLRRNQQAIPILKSLVDKSEYSDQAKAILKDLNE